MKVLKEVGTYDWQEQDRQVGRLLPGMVLDSQANLSLRLILVDSLSSMWKIGEMIVRMSEVVSTLDMFKKFIIQEIEGEGEGNEPF